MKKLLVPFFLLCCFVSGYTQTWVSVGNGLSVGGYVRTLFVYDSVLYAGGHFSSPGNNIAQWDNNAWTNLGSGINNNVYSIGTYRGTVYMGGYFTSAGGHSASCITKWDGTSFSNAGFDVQGGSVNAIYAYDSLLYIGGGFDSINNSLHYPCLVSWDGNKIDSIYYTNLRSVSVFTDYNNLLLIGFSPGNGFLTTWNNITLSNLGNHFPYFTNRPSTAVKQNAFCQANGNLYIGGSFIQYSNGLYKEKVTNIAMWQDTTWVSMGKGIQGTVYAITFYNNMIIAGGSFDSAGGLPANNIAAWNGSSWEPLGSGLNGPVYALAVFDTVLYAGGSFITPGNGIAKYVPEATSIPQGSATLFPNPSNGIFTIQLSSINLQLSVQIYNILGQSIYLKTFTSQSAQIDLSEEMPGVYLYRVSSADGNTVNTGKLIIE